MLASACLGRLGLGASALNTVVDGNMPGGYDVARPVVVSPAWNRQDATVADRGRDVDP
jgi:hypothetical protein